MIKHIAAALLAFALAWPAFASTPVNVNTADATTLAHSLDGVGPSKAAAIVAYREAHGPFKSVDDVGQVKGIGPATLERNRSAILLTDASSNTTTAPQTPPPAKASTKASKPAKASGE